MLQVGGNGTWLAGAWPPAWAATELSTWVGLRADFLPAVVLLGSSSPLGNACACLGHACEIITIRQFFQLQVWDRHPIHSGLS